MNTFWMVKGPKGSPNMQYVVKHLAVVEAKRLASVHEGQFFVLEAVQAFTRGEVPVLEVPVTNPVEEDFA